MLHQNRKEVRQAGILAAVMLTVAIVVTSNTFTVYATEAVTSESIIEEEFTDVIEDAQPKDKQPNGDSATPAETAPPGAEDNSTEATTSKKKSKKTEATTDETTTAKKKKSVKETEGEVLEEETPPTTTVVETTTTAATTTVATTQATTWATTTTVATTAWEPEPPETEVVEEPPAEETELLTNDDSEEDVPLTEDLEPTLIQLGSNKDYVSADEYQQLINRVSELESKKIWCSVALFVGCFAVVLSIIALAASMIAFTSHDATTRLEEHTQKLHAMLASIYTIMCTIQQARQKQKTSASMVNKKPKNAPSDEQDDIINENIATVIDELHDILEEYEK